MSFDRWWHPVFGGQKLEANAVLLTTGTYQPYRVGARYEQLSLFSLWEETSFSPHGHLLFQSIAFFGPLMTPHHNHNDDDKSYLLLNSPSTRRSKNHPYAMHPDMEQHHLGAVIALASSWNASLVVVLTPVASSSFAETTKMELHNRFCRGNNIFVLVHFILDDRAKLEVLDRLSHRVVHCIVLAHLL